MSRILSKVTDRLYEKACSEIKMPQSPNQLANAAREFAEIVGFPRVIEAIMAATASSNHRYSKISYVKRKGFHSLNLQVTCSASYLTLHFSVRFPGGSHDYTLKYFKCFFPSTKRCSIWEKTQTTHFCLFFIVFFCVNLLVAVSDRNKTVR